MQALEHLTLGSMLDTLVSVGAAFVLGSLVS